MRVAKKFNGNDDSNHLRVKGEVISLKISRGKIFMGGCILK